MKVLFFGDLLLRLNPPLYERFVQANEFKVTYTGAEANVAVSISNLGLEAEFVTKVPNNEIGQAALNALRKYGVSVKGSVIGGDRLGLFYLEKGASQRGGKVIYDRANSTFALSKRSDYDWDAIFEDVRWFHLTGITPALSDELVEVCLEALKKAKEKGVIVSIDLNYRSKLWTKEKANDVFKQLLPYVDYCKDLLFDEDDSIRLEEKAKKMIKDFNLKGVAVTLRKSKSASEHNFSAVYVTKESIYYSKEYTMHLVDRVGGGDAFSAGWIYALISNYTPQETIEFAVAASCLKHTIEGDFNLVTKDEVENLVNGDTLGRVQR